MRYRALTCMCWRWMVSEPMPSRKPRTRTTSSNLTLRMTHLAGEAGSLSRWKVRMSRYCHGLSVQTRRGKSPPGSVALSRGEGMKSRRLPSRQKPRFPASTKHLHGSTAHFHDLKVQDGDVSAPAEVCSLAIPGSEWNRSAQAPSDSKFRSKARSNLVLVNIRPLRFNHARLSSKSRASDSLCRNIDRSRRASPTMSEGGWRAVPSSPAR
ncbi:hypothetical protein VTK56DRAFT_4562 [Thermocarpiscus australiensis]